MANSLLKLTVESSEYDAKLKKAAEGIRHLADVAHKSDGDLTGLEKSTLDYIKSVGEMETKSRSAAGQVRELESTYKELKVIYDQLNDVEKADEGGKALAASLEQIKQRAQEARAQLDTASKSLNDNGQSAQQSGGILESLAGKFTLNIDALKLFDMGLSATKAALDVAKDAFFASEANVDEWGRTVAASQSLYEGFLTAINNGDISGYLSNIDSIVKAARLAYDELDKLGTMKTIQAPQISKQQTENERIRMMIQTGRYIAPQDGRSNTIFNGRVIQDGDKLTAGQIRAMEKQLQSGMQNVTKLVGNEVKQTGKAIDAYYNKIAKTNGMTLQEFKKGTSSWEEFSKKMEGYDQYKEWDRQARAEFAKQGGRGFVDFDKNNPYAEFKKWGTFRVDKEGDNSYKDLVGLIQQRDQQIGQMYSTQAQAYRTMNRAEGVTVRQIMGGTGGKGGKTTKTDIKYADDSIMAQENLIGDLTQKWKTASGELRDGYLKQLDEAKAKLKEMTTDPLKELEEGFENNFETGSVSPAQAFIDRIRGDLAQANLDEDMATFSQVMTNALKGGIDDTDLSGISEDLFRRMLDGENIPDEVWDELKEYIQEQIPGLFPSAESGSGSGGNNNSDRKNNPLLHTDENGKQYVKANELLGSISSGMSSVVRGLEQLGVDIPDEIKSVLGGMQSISTILTGIATTVIAIEALSAADFFKPLANGGIVGRAAGGMFIPGNSFSGDRLRMPVDGGSSMIGVNSGELILNRAQQGIIAQELEGGAQQGWAPQVRLEGEEIWIALNNYTSRTGYGEVLTSRA